MKLTEKAKIGLVTIIAIVLLFIGFNFLKGINVFNTTNDFYVKLSELKDITQSTPIFANGYNIGLVRKIHYDYSNFERSFVEINLDNRIKIPKGSHVRVKTNFLKGGELHIIINKESQEFLEPGDTLQGEPSTDLFTSLEEEIVPSLQLLIPKIDSILDNLNYLTSHPAINGSMDNIQTATQSLKETTQKINGLMSTQMPEIVTNLTEVSRNFKKLSNEVSTLDLQKTFDQINHTLRNLEMFSDNLNNPNGSLGLLLNNKDLYNRINKTVDNTDKLLIDIRENPKRYVHFSIF